MSVRFTPSRCEGTDGVIEVVVSGDRLELITASGSTVFPLAELGAPPSLAESLRRRPRFIGERDWFHPPAERFIRFYTEPRITVFMPATDTQDGETFQAIRRLLRMNRLATYDLG